MTARSQHRPRLLLLLLLLLLRLLLRLLLLLLQVRRPAGPQVPSHPVTLQSLAWGDPLARVWIEQSGQESHHLPREMTRAHDADAMGQHGGVALAL